MTRHFGFPDAVHHVVGAGTAVSLAMTHLICERPEPDRAAPPPEEDAFSIMVQTAPLARHEKRLRSAPLFSGEVPAGGVGIVHLEDRPTSRMWGRFEAVQYYVPRRTLDDLASEWGGARIDRLAWPRAAPDPVAATLTSLLLPLIGSDAPTSSLFIEHLTTAFLSHAVSSYGGFRFTARQVRGGLSALHERRVIELMNASLRERLSVAELARACDLTVSHFTVAFKKSFGLPPHSYYIRMRIDAARRMMLATNLPLADVAARCGFGDQSHFTRVFTSVVGHRPGAWRRACKP